MNPTLLQEIIASLQNDTTLQTLATGGVKVAFAALPTTIELWSPKSRRWTVAR